jgi:hypothetical protein
LFTEPRISALCAELFLIELATWSVKESVCYSTFRKHGSHSLDIFTFAKCLYSGTIWGMIKPGKGLKVF